jgi:hypothetical protein
MAITKAKRAFNRLDMIEESCYYAHQWPEALRE